MLDNVTNIQVNNGEVSILIKKQEHGKDFSINIEFSQEEVNNSCEISEKVVADVKKTVAVTPEVSNEIADDAPVQCDLYQTNQNTERHC